MATSERREDRGRTRAEAATRAIGAEIRLARIDAGLSLDVASRTVGLSASTMARIERAKLPNVSVRQLSLACSAVGLDLALRAYPDGDPARDAGHAALLERVRRCLPAGAPWRTEVPLPIRGDRRAWDAMTILERRRIHLEAEMRIGDVQALERKIELKRRDGGVETVILVIADTRHNRRMLAAHRESLRAAFPLDTRAVLGALRAGRAPSASGIVVI
jgi:transcriptional regulator with XRE-family HTH domain